MAELTANRRKQLRAKVFGLPAERKYPMPDAAHAGNAKARASQQFNAGNLSAGQKAQIDARANQVLKG